MHVLLSALERIAKELCPVILATHPRTQKVIEASGTTLKHIVSIPPVPYAEMLLLEQRARMILTDSGGVQKEAYFFRVPCITLREETEWIETLENQCNVLAGPHDPERITDAAKRARYAGPWIDHYGTGKAGMCIADHLVGRTTRHSN
jgi:UDP-GlcNAc3NAcA epimerase